VNETLFSSRGDVYTGRRAKAWEGAGGEAELISVAYGSQSLKWEGERRCLNLSSSISLQWSG
jgi:hypothetical protein